MSHCGRWQWEGDLKGKRASGSWFPRLYRGAEREVLLTTDPVVFHPRVQLAKMAPLGLRALQVYRECLVRGERLVLLDLRETE